MPPFVPGPHTAVRTHCALTCVCDVQDKLCAADTDKVVVRALGLHCVLWRMPSTAYCFTLTVCCVWHVSLQGETLEKAQPAPADNTFKVGDAVGIAHM